MNAKLIATSVLTVVLLAGCAIGNDRIKNLTTDEVNAVFSKDNVTRDQVVQAFGSPTTVKDGTEDGTKVLSFIWSRWRMSAKNYIPLNPIYEYPTTKKVLEVTVDSNGKVLKHNFSGSFYVHRRPLIGDDSIHSMRPLTPDELNSLTDPEEEPETKEAIK
jgi:hypothetical protein